MELSRTARFYISLSIVITIFIVAVSIVGQGLYQVYYDQASLFKGDFAVSTELETHFGERVINIALVGLDLGTYRPESDRIHRVDTVMAASINFDRDTVALINIPRDAYIEIAHAGTMDKISRSYRYGYLQGNGDPHQEGLRYAVDTLSLALGGVILHYYVAMDMEALIKLVDAFGGVWFDVDISIQGDDVLEQLHAGPQQLLGTGYLTYLTYREPDAEDDLARINRQRELLLATFQYFKQTDRFQSIIPTYNVYRKHVFTNLSVQQIAALSVYAGDQLDPDAIRVYSLRGEYRESGEVLYFMLDREDRSTVLKEVFGIEVDPG